MDAKDTPVSIPPQEDLTEVRKPTSLLVAQFFLFPLIIIAFGIGIFILFGSIAFDQKSAEEYLAEVRQRDGSRRWQAAFEFANVVTAHRDDLQHDPALARTLEDTYRSAMPAEGVEGTEEAWRLRQYLAFSMGELGNPEFVPALIEGLWDGAPETQMATLVSLGKIGDPGAAPHVARLLTSEDSGVRMTAVYVLGVLENPETLRDLRVALNDSAVDVRWNAAMALARMDDRSGADILIQLTDRSYLVQFTEMSEAQKNQTIINAVTCLGLLKLERAREQIVALSTGDPSITVRSAALAALESF